MSRSTLAAILDAEGVDPDAYQLGEGWRDERFVLEISPPGWVVYYAERGLRSGERRFETEDDACRFLLDRLLADPGTRRRS